MPDAKRVDIEQILRDREEKRKAATQGEWGMSSPYPTYIRTYGTRPIYQIADFPSEGNYHHACDEDYLRGNAQHIVTEHNTGEQVDAALRKALPLIKRARKLLRETGMTFITEEQAEWNHDSTELFRDFGVKLED